MAEERRRKRSGARRAMKKAAGSGRSAHTREDPAERSRIMRAVKSRDTAPELTVRRITHRMGFRFSLKRDDLPGKPDLALPKYRAAIFVHGCFWHGHRCRRGARAPKTNAEYWRGKIARNRARDRRVAAELRSRGWRVLAIYECQLKREAAVGKRIKKFLGAVPA
jgi:DNA mismatch endonuclease (patch repair protein)